MLNNPGNSDVKIERRAYGAFYDIRHKLVLIVIANVSIDLVGLNQAFWGWGGGVREGRGEGRA